MDGVLIDSIPHHVSSWQQIFAEYGIDIPGEVLRRAEGEKAKLTMQRLAREHGVDWSDEQMDDLIARKRRLYRKSAPRGMRPVAKNAVQFCRDHGLKTAIVTGSIKPNLEWTLDDEERALFDLLLTSEYYNKSKPHPEPFLNAAKNLELDPSECLVVENAPLGIRSAKAAGMVCLAITTTLPQEDLQEADIIVNDLDELKNLLVSDEINNIKPGG